jgi:hypothetical protein
LQFATYMGTDMEALKTELGGLSESELRAIMEGEGLAARPAASLHPQ